VKALPEDCNSGLKNKHNMAFESILRAVFVYKWLDGLYIAPLMHECGTVPAAQPVKRAIFQLTGAQGLL
jgi:hypothetical protein